jgi:hypothetical protein
MPMKTLLVRRVSLLALWFGISSFAGWAAPALKDFDANAAFEQLKALAGEWQGQTSESGQKTDLKVLYQVTANGNALVETIFPGSPHEMVTVYHLDGKKLMLTHYCAAGNQPRMVLNRKSTPAELAFDFAGATNLKSGKEGHMHALRLRFDNPGQLSAEWDYFKDGKKQDCTRFSLKRSCPARVDTVCAGQIGGLAPAVLPSFPANLRINNAGEAENDITG